MSRAYKNILIVFFLSAFIGLKFIALAEGALADGKVTRIEQSFVTPADETSTEEVITRPVMEYKSDNLRDPFKSYLIKETVKELPSKSSDSIKPKLDLDKIKVQGIIWGVKTPQAIINDKVLTIGDSIEDAEIVKIEQNGIIVNFNGEMFVLAVPGKNSVETEESNVK